MTELEKWLLYRADCRANMERYSPRRTTQERLEYRGWEACYARAEIKIAKLRVEELLKPAAR